MYLALITAMVFYKLPSKAYMKMVAAYLTKSLLSMVVLLTVLSIGLFAKRILSLSYNIIVPWTKKATPTQSEVGVIS